MALYIIPCILIVNTHYFGALFVSASFIFYIGCNLDNHTFSIRKSLTFLVGNIVIAFSLLPYFAITALNKALLDKTFNDNKGSAGIYEFCILLGAIIVLIMFTLVFNRGTFFKKNNKKEATLFHYCLAIPCLILMQAIIISLFRPFLKERYFVISNSKFDFILRN
jgi:hypothetical protein